MGVARLSVILLCCLSMACSPIGSPNNGQLDQGSLGLGCNSATRNKLSQASKTPPPIKKWNFENSGDGLGVASKSGSGVIPMGQKVVMVLDNQCIQDEGMSEGLKQLMSDSELEKSSSNETERSYVSFHLDQSWRVGDLKSLVESSDCILTFEEGYFWYAKIALFYAKKKTRKRAKRI